MQRSSKGYNCESTNYKSFVGITMKISTQRHPEPNNNPPRRYAPNNFKSLKIFIIYVGIQNGKKMFLNFLWSYFYFNFSAVLNTKIFYSSRVLREYSMNKYQHNLTGHRERSRIDNQQLTELYSYNIYNCCSDTIFFSQVNGSKWANE